MRWFRPNLAFLGGPLFRLRSVDMTSARCHVSSSRLVERSMRTSRTALWGFAPPQGSSGSLVVTR